MSAPVKTSTHIRVNALINEIKRIQQDIDCDQTEYEMHKREGNEELQKYFLAQCMAKKKVIERLTKNLNINLPEEE
ncbi:hypothetical protein B7C51_15730 [Paenibacillus larvae subsp. pulvifaciens]|uniref:DUF2524 domain-containing protein n=2 Tax=Paenibacillus larvae TaxID=1464 RepID=A0A1V0UVG9_9BACL|nr:hypothetical protein [Paenibacillus larvae]ARF68940.1 hypothetical protein B7C51_15730 [Paenibacillus larvae subsp. pulvifaciens]QHZ49926.1 hypothetical protein ERICV_00745 [Paenibacillus larvae subsp. larvae]